MERGTIVCVKVRQNIGPWYIQSQAVVVKFIEYGESFAAHQMTVLSCSTTGTCRTTPPPPTIIASSSSSAAWVQPVKLDCDRCSRLPQRPGPERAVSPSTLGWGELNRTSVKKSLQREKEPCAAHLPDKRFNQPALRHPSPPLGPWDELKSATTITWWKYPLTMARWEQPERLDRDWVWNHFNYYMHTPLWGVGGWYDMLTPPSVDIRGNIKDWNQQTGLRIRTLLTDTDILRYSYNSASNKQV